MAVFVFLAGMLTTSAIIGAAVTIEERLRKRRRVNADALEAERILGGTRLTIHRAQDIRVRLSHAISELCFLDDVLKRAEWDDACENDDLDARYRELMNRLPEAHSAVDAVFRSVYED